MTNLFTKSLLWLSFFFFLSSFRVCLWKGSSMIMEVTMLTWWIWTNWARENFSPFDCQTTFLDRLKVLNVHSDDPFYYLHPPPSYFTCHLISFALFMKQRNAMVTTRINSLQMDISLQSAMAYGTMEQHVVGDTGCDALVAHSDHVGIDP